MALPLYALTLFVSAFILFLVQPIIGKILLPKLGGTPQVWNTCMVFFQMVLLAGYAYTHNATTRLTLRQQLIAHAVLLFLPLIVLLPVPFALSFLGTDPETGRLAYSIREFVPTLGSNPIPSTLKILFLYVALPFVVVATSAPLLQRWFGHTGHPAAKDPYFLYGASNFGSMLSLILYPFVVEPYLTLQNQAWLYVIGYVLLIAFVLACAALVWNAREAKPKLEHKVEPAPAVAATTAVAETQTGIASGAPAPTPAPAAATGIKSGQPGKQQPRPGARPQLPAEPTVAMASDEVTFGRRLRWVMLAAVPSSLMLGITTHITTDLSPIPFFWLVPLILYLGSFILVFMRWPFLWTERLHEPSTHGGITPHTIMLYAQPLCLFFMVMVDVWNLTSSPAMISVAILAHGLGFFATTMVCHGELAKDRPQTKHLTEFYLWMSVGGMVGGMFNALIAPIIFYKLWELPIAIFAAAIVRPKMFDTGLFDNLLAGTLETPAEAQTALGKHKGPRIQQGQTASPSLVSTLDWVWALGILVIAGGLMIFRSDAIARSQNERDSVLQTIIAFGIPLALACMQMARPIRIGVGIGAVLLMHQIHTNRTDTRSVYASRSYFGTISVKEGSTAKRVEGKDVILTYRQLVHGHINHGLNFSVPPIEKNKRSDRGDPERDFSRLATTYYHREGPVGRVMEKFNWNYKGPPNTYHADARIPASLVGNIVADLGAGVLPVTEFVTLWSEPPIATVGLGTGTMASYGRPYQHVHFYEIDNQILRLSLVMPTRKITSFAEYDKAKADTPPKHQAYFNYLERAMERGSTVQVLMGDARLRMALPYKNHYLDETDRGGGPDNFYHMMVVDAFSSDAIPAHLLTEEAFEMYFKKLVPEGVLCVHTSNRFVDLPKVVGAVSDKLKWSDFELTLDSIDAAKKTDVIDAVNEATGLGLKDATDLVGSAPKAVKAGLSKQDAARLKARLENSGAKVSVKEHSHSYKARRGHDVNDSHEAGHYTSEWVMVARKIEYILQREGDADFEAAYQKALQARPGGGRTERYWDPPEINSKYLWTDDYYNLMSVVRFR